MRRSMPTGLFATALTFDLPGHLSRPTLVYPFAFQDWTLGDNFERIVWDFSRGNVCLHDDAPEAMQLLFEQALEKLGNGCGSLLPVAWGKKGEG